MLDVVPSCNFVQYHEKLMMQLWENGELRFQTLKKPTFGPDFDPNLVPKILLWALSLVDVIHCCKLSFHVISKKTNEPNLRKWQKT